MILLTNDQCVEWCVRNNLEVPVRSKAVDPACTVRIEPVPLEQSFAFSGRLEESLGPWHKCLLWVVATDIWRSSANLHLYYRLRSSYGGNGLIEEQPGHLFLHFERADLITFLQIGFLSGWDMHVLSDMNYGRLFVSHDSWVDIWRSSEQQREGVAAMFRQT
jgi:hypothetical protein